MPNTNETKGALPFLALAPISTPQGAMERAFLAEARSPADPRYDPQVDLQAMRDMRQVVENRLKTPSEYMARGATNAIGIFKAPNQFPELKDYPNGIPGDVDDMVNFANDPRNSHQAIYWQHVQNAITAATESVATPVASLPEATAWKQTPPPGSPPPSLGPNFYRLGDVGGNTFFGTRFVDYKADTGHSTSSKASNAAVSALRRHAAEARADAATRPVSAHMKLHDMLMKLSPQLPSVAPIPGRAGQRQAALPPRDGISDAAGLSGISRPPGAAASPTTGAAGQGAALTGYRKIIADAHAQAAEARAIRNAGRAAMGLATGGGDLSSRSFAPVGGAGSMGRFANHAMPGGALAQDQMAAGQFLPSGSADALYPRPQPQRNGDANSALPGVQPSPASLSPSNFERALDRYFFRLSRLPPSGGAAFNPYLSPVWAGLKLPG